MKGTPAIYLGRIVDKKHFRTFIFGANGEKKLVESWSEYEAAMQSGIWFATVEDAEAIKAIADAKEEEPAKSKPKPRSKPQAKSKAEPVEEVDDSEEAAPMADGSVFEVTDENR